MPSRPAIGRGAQQVRPSTSTRISIYIRALNSDGRGLPDTTTTLGRVFFEPIATGVTEMQCVKHY